MQIQSVKLACFSPTGTSRKIVQSIAAGLGYPSIELVDVTKSEAREKPLQAAKDDLLVIAVPVYVGRVPHVLEGWLQSLSIDKTPVVCVAVYGNREYEDALLELKDVVLERGGVPIAGAAFIGEHSYSSDQTPIAVSRPDAADLEQAEKFGQQVAEKLEALGSIEDVNDLSVLGSYPYRKFEGSPAIDFIAVNDQCTECGVCAEKCPVDAISPTDFSEIDTEACIFCCACIKACPENARSMKDGMFMDIANRLTTMCQERKEPVYFF